MGGVAYLASLTEGLPRRPVIEEYIRIVKDKSLLRRLMMICSSAIARAADQSEDAIGVLDVTESQLLEVSEKGLSQGLDSVDKIVANSFGTIDNLYKHSREVTGLATDYTELDRMTSGCRRANSSSLPRGPRWARRRSPSTSRRMRPSITAPSWPSSAWK